MLLRTQSVSIHDSMCDDCHLQFGVPQCSVLGPLVFVQYTKPIGIISKKWSPLDIYVHLISNDNSLINHRHTKWTPYFLAMIPIGFVHMTNTKGPSTETWGTLNCKWQSSDILSCIDTLWLRSFRYDWNHSRTLPDKPNIFFNRQKRTTWSTVSKAAW